ncbi:TPA: fimbrial protein [Citrobacter freundii]
MSWHVALLIMLFWTSGGLARSSVGLSPLGMALSQYSEKGNSWGYGRTSFKGMIIVPACTLEMKDTYQSVELGSTSIRDLHDLFSGQERMFHLHLRNCELVNMGKRIYTANRVRITFDGMQGETLNRFSVIDQINGINIQITDSQGYTARVGEVMPSQKITGGEEILNYTFRIFRNSKELKPGDYYVVLRFKIDYE